MRRFAPNPAVSPRRVSRVPLQRGHAIGGQRPASRGNSKHKTRNGHLTHLDYAQGLRHEAHEGSGILTQSSQREQRYSP